MSIDISATFIKHWLYPLIYGAKLGMLWQDLKTDDDYGKFC